VSDWLISPPIDRDSDLRIETGLLAQELTARWPDVRFVERDDAANTMRWALKMPNGHDLWAELHSQGQVIGVDADVYDAAEFARWVRSQVPESYPLIFWDAANEHDVPLTQDSTVETIAAPFLARR